MDGIHFMFFLFQMGESAAFENCQRGGSDNGTEVRGNLLQRKL